MKSPVILVPGTLGSRLWGNFLQSPSTCSYSPQGWFALYLSLTGNFTSFGSSCWFKAFSLRFSEEMGTYALPEFIRSRVAEFGRVSSIAYLNPQDPEPLQQPSFQPVIEYLERLGYVANRNILAAPYDFRFAADERFSEPAMAWFRKMKRLIEISVRRNGHRRAIIYSYSLGCMYVLRFLHEQSGSWRRRFIKSFIGVGCPLSGVPDIPKLFASGDDQGLEINPSKLRTYQITAESNAWLFPNPIAWNNTRPLVIDQSTSPPTVYTVIEMGSGKYLKAALRPGEPDYQNALPRLQHLLSPYLETTGPPIDVPATFLFRSGLNTSYQFIYPDGLYSDNVDVITMPNGDGRVTDESRNLCMLWANPSVNCVLLKNIPVKDPNGTETILGHEDLFYDPQSLAILNKAILLP